MIFHKMIEICLKDDNMHGFVMINALICINIYVITCINSMLSQDIETCIKEVMTINEGVDFEELPLDELTGELKPLPSTLKYAFLDSQQVKPVIISS